MLALSYQLFVNGTTQLFQKWMGLDYTINENDFYAAMDWLITQQEIIQNKLSKSLFNGDKDYIALYDLTSTYFEGEKCKIAYNRDKKSGKLQINIGLLCDHRGCPVATKVYQGNTNDARTVMDAVERLKTNFKLKQIIFVGDKEMITSSVVKKFLVFVGLVP